MSRSIRSGYSKTEMNESIYAHTITPVPNGSQTDDTSRSPSLRCNQSDNGLAAFTLDYSNHLPTECRANFSEAQDLRTHDVIFNQGDIVGRYLAQRAAQATGSTSLQAPGPDYVNDGAGYRFQGLPYATHNDSYASLQPSKLWYPNPESIRHLHTMQSLLPHIQPERRLNALNGLELDIVEGHTGNILCRAVPKKMLVLFLGRDVVSKYLHTIRREDNEVWRGMPTHQFLELPNKVASVAAITILVAWMTRACKYTTMHTMEQVRLPKSLFVACSLGQTMELLGLRRDAYRVDLAISQQLLKRPIHVVEIETLWRCLGEGNKYVYGCIKAVANQSQDTRMAGELKDLAEICPRLYARICSPTLNEDYRPHFGRDWFEKLISTPNDYDEVRTQDKKRPISVLSTQAPMAHAPGIHIRFASRLNPHAPEFKPMVRT